jgi:hypothetical protein
MPEAHIRHVNETRAKTGLGDKTENAAGGLDSSG